MDLFSSPDGPTDGVLVGCQGTLAPDQHKVDPDYGFAFDININVAVINPLAEALVKLLQKRPELAEKAWTPTEWSSLLRENNPDGLGDLKTGYGAIARSFWANREQLEKHLFINKMPNPANRGHIYQLGLRNSEATGCALVSTAIISS
jgi:hypothetical protein